MQITTPTLPIPTCSICLDDIFPTTNKTLTCNHSFHATCIKQWINSSIHQAESAYHKPRDQPSCPLCKRTIEPVDKKQTIAPALKVLVSPRTAAQNRAAALAAIMLPPDALRYSPREHPSVASIMQEAQPLRENGANDQNKPSFLQTIALWLSKFCIEDDSRPEHTL